MKFIITESKFQNIVFSYIDSLLDKIDFYGDVYYVYKGTQNGVIKCCNGTKSQVWSKIIHNVSDMFSLDYPSSHIFVLRWINSRIDDNVNKLITTPYNIYVSDFLFPQN